MREITGMTRVLGIIGHPVAHSLSPLMQNAALAAMGLDYIYVPFPVPSEGVAAAVNGLRALGVAGFNVTIPHKSAVIPFLDGLSPEALRIGAVNTVNREGDRLVGYNTDGIGFLQSLRDDLGFHPAGLTVLVLGAGGAARAAVAALCEAGVRRIVLANRSPERARSLASDFGDRYGAAEFALSTLAPAEMEMHLGRADLLVNTTSVGMGGTSFASLDLAPMKPSAKVYDMVYSPPETALLASAKGRGLACANGIGMLAAQGEAAFALWIGAAPPPGLMKGRLLTALGP